MKSSEYGSFIFKLVNFARQNLKESDDRYLNVYFDEGIYWFEVEDHLSIDLLSRFGMEKRNFDPVISFSLYEIKRENAFDEEDGLTQFIANEISEDLFLTWLEFS